MEINIEVCKTISVQYGLPLQFVIKEFHLFDVLSQIAEINSQEGNKLVFKGGTALNKVYLKKGQRFSEDIDFDVDKESSYAFSRDLAGKIKGYTAGALRKVRKTTMFFCEYETRLGGKYHIRVDISSKKIITSAPPRARSAVSEITHASVSGLNVYGMEDLVARKMNALCSRTEGKDVYDVHSSLPLCNKLGKAIKMMLESEENSSTPDEFLAATINAVKNADFKQLRNHTNPFIPLPYRPNDWLELKNDLLLKLENLKV
jgi:predicted nucleotidyltransferase component of viral defense system